MLMQEKALRDEESRSQQSDDLTEDLTEERKKKEKRMDKMIDGGIDRVKSVKPSMLKGLVTNSLEKAMEYSFKLRERAKHSSIDKTAFKAVGEAMEEYACHLIEPLKSDIVKRAIFQENDFDRIADNAVLWKQKKFLAHPVVYDILRKRWTGNFFEWQNSIIFELKWWWILLNLWTFFDVLLFPIVHVVFHLIHWPIRFWKKRRVSTELTTKRHAVEKTYYTYFMTPYFIFFRDALSYFALLALHFVICIQVSTLNFTNVEWAIMLFFLGRFMIEMHQVIIGINATRRQRCTSVLTMLNRYISDGWNVLDTITLAVYIVLVSLRVYTWFAYTTVLNNRLLAVAGYLYGLNSMLLTLRLFGQIMELKQSTGAIQKALFQVIGAVFAVFCQFFTALLAFSLAITKINTVEVSFTSTRVIHTSLSEWLYTDQGGISNWWKVTRHLFWSVLIDPNLLLSSDETSNALIQILYGLFLLVSVVMLMNMMIALLTNTYQRVEDNALYEWSCKKAATIRTYCNYHSVPVPFNIISLTVILLRYLVKRMCCNRCSESQYVTNNDFEKENSQTDLYKKSFRKMIMELESMYFSVYGDEFPIKGDKLHHVVKQTDGNHLLIGHIAERLFTTHGYKDCQCVTPQNTQEWDVKGISILGNRLSYTSCECKQCKTRLPKGYHGARCRNPLSNEMPGFEILIEHDSNTKHNIILGVVTDNFDLHKDPGMEGNTVGYQVEKEIIFDINTQRTHCWPKIDNLPKMADRGDILGCEILYGRQSENDVPVLFTLNGREIGEATLENSFSASERFHAFVGIGSKGISVRFRPRFLKDVTHGMDQSSIMLKQIIDQLSQLNKKYSDLTEEIDDLRSEMRRSQKKYGRAL